MLGCYPNSPAPALVEDLGMDFGMAHPEVVDIALEAVAILAAVEAPNGKYPY